MAGPKVKYDKEYILKSGLAYINKYGIDEFSTRKLANYIGSSTQPIFRTYGNLGALLSDIEEEIASIQDKFVLDYSKKYENEFLGIGLGYIKFAEKHPNFFSVLFMNKNSKNKSLSDLSNSDDSNKEVVSMLSMNLNVSKEASSELLRNIWLLCHGIATFVYSKQISYDEEEIKEILRSAFIGFAMKAKGENNND